MHYDVIVIGLGATGGATFYHLAKSGMRVLGIDAASPPHDGGSSHGATRIYRQAYYEAPEYVTLVLRALELWYELEVATNQKLFTRTGALTIGPENGELLRGALHSARTHAIPHDLLDRGDVRKRFPVFEAPEGMVGLFEPAAGVLNVDACIAAHITLGQTQGGTLRTEETVIAIEPCADQVVVRTTRDEYSGGRVIVAAGAWTPKLLQLEHAFRVTREVVHWVLPASPHAAAPECPVSMIQYCDGPIFYSIPDFGEGFKAGLHHAGPTTDPSTTQPFISDADSVARAIAAVAPGASGPLVRSTPCYYTTTADHHFVVGPLDRAPNVIVASACSGHGFKFAPALGEHLAAMARDKETQSHPLFATARLILT